MSSTKKPSYDSLLNSILDRLINKTFVQKFTELTEDLEKEVQLVYRHLMVERENLCDLFTDYQVGGKNAQLAEVKHKTGKIVGHSSTYTVSDAHKRAVALFSEALCYAPSEDHNLTGSSLLGQCYQSRSKAFFALGQFDEALKDLRAAVHSGQTLDLDANLIRCQSLAELGRLHEAQLEFDWIPEDVASQDKTAVAAVGAKLKKLVKESGDNQVEKNDELDETLRRLRRCSQLLGSGRIHEIILEFDRIKPDRRKQSTCDAKLFAKLYDFTRVLITGKFRRKTSKVDDQFREALNSTINSLNQSGQFHSNPAFPWLHSSVEVQCDPITKNYRLAVTKPVAAGTILALTEPFQTTQTLEGEVQLSSISCGHCLAPLNHTTQKWMINYSYRSVPCEHCTVEQYCSEECRHLAVTEDLHPVECGFRGWLEPQVAEHRSVRQYARLALRVVMKTVAKEQHSFDQLRRRRANHNADPTSGSIFEHAFLRHIPALPVNYRMELVIEACLMVLLAYWGRFLNKMPFDISSKEDQIFLCTLVYRLVLQTFSDPTTCTRVSSLVGNHDFMRENENVLFFDPTLALLRRDVCNPNVTCDRFNPKPHSRLFTLTAIRQIPVGAQLCAPHLLVGREPESILLYDMLTQNRCLFEKMKLRCECSDCDNQRVEFCPVGCENCQGRMSLTKEGFRACRDCEWTITQTNYSLMRKRIRTCTVALTKKLLELELKSFNISELDLLSEEFFKVFKYSYLGSEFIYLTAERLIKLYLDIKPEWLDVLRAWSLFLLVKRSLERQTKSQINELILEQSNLMVIELLDFLVKKFQSSFDTINNIDRSAFSAEASQCICNFLHEFECMQQTLQQAKQTYFLDY